MQVFLGCFVNWRLQGWLPAIRGRQRAAMTGVYCTEEGLSEIVIGIGVAKGAVADVQLSRLRLSFMCMQSDRS